MNLKWLQCIFFLLLSQITWSQSRNQWLKMAEDAKEMNDPLRFAECIGEVYRMDSSDFDFVVQYANALRDARDYREAERLYAEAYSRDKGKLFPDGLFYLALMQKHQEKYEEALRNFQRYEKKYKRSDKPLVHRARVEADGCTFAINSRHAHGVDVKPLPGNTQTSQSEFAPTLFDSILFYTGQIDTRLGVRKALLVDGLYEVATYRFNAATPGTDNGNLVFSPDKTRAYFTECIDSTCRIMEAEIVAGVIQSAAPIPTLNQTGFRSTMPWVAKYKDGEVMFFSSDRLGTHGGLDIWWSLRENNTWLPPVNAGTVVNTERDEVSPFYNENQLFFSTDGFPGYGGLDIFLSEGEPRTLTSPQNIGAPYNSAVNDLYYRYFPSISSGMLSSNRGQSVRDNTFCCNDLYLVSIADSVKTSVPAQLYASLEELNYYLPVTLYFHNDEPNPNSRDTRTRLSYIDCFDSYHRLKGTYESENSKGLSGDAKDDALLDVESFYLLQLDKGMSDLNQFIQLLQLELEKGNSIQLTIKGFASPRAKSDYNVNLTKRRISSLKNLLYTVNDGVFRSYIDQEADNHATLTFAEVPFGEYAANTTVSDELEDEKKSIYSLGARLERKIEIQSVQRGRPDSLFSAATFVTSLIDLGPIPLNTQQDVVFRVRNSGTDTLRIDSIAADCSCTVPSISKNVILPGQESQIRAVYMSDEAPGVFIKRIRVFTNAREEEYELVITGEKTAFVPVQNKK